MRIRHLVLAIACAMGVHALSLAAQAGQTPTPDKGGTPGIQFLGEVQAVDSQHKKITVKHGAIRGYALRGTDDYSVANESILTRLRPGDDIRAIVYPSDKTLYNIEIVYRNAGKKSE